MSYDLYVVTPGHSENFWDYGTTLTMTMAATSTTRTISARSSPPIVSPVNRLGRQDRYRAGSAK